MKPDPAPASDGVPVDGAGSSRKRSVERVRRDGRPLVAVALIALTAAAGVGLVVRVGGGERDEGPVPWAMVEVGPDQKTIVVKPFGEFGGGCREVRTDLDQDGGTVRLTIQIHHNRCEAETLESSDPPITEVTLPDGIPARGLQLEGPGFLGALPSDRWENAFAYSDDRGGRRYPNVVGLRWDLARDILNAARAQSVKPNGPTSSAAHVTAQSPPGGAKIPGEPRTLKEARKVTFPPATLTTAT